MQIANEPQDLRSYWTKVYLILAVGFFLSTLLRQKNPHCDPSTRCPMRRAAFKK